MVCRAQCRGTDPDDARPQRRRNRQFHLQSAKGACRLVPKTGHCHSPGSKDGRRHAQRASWYPPFAKAARCRRDDVGLSSPRRVSEKVGPWPWSVSVRWSQLVKMHQRGARLNTTHSRENTYDEQREGRVIPGCKVWNGVHQTEKGGDGRSSSRVGSKSAGAARSSRPHVGDFLTFSPTFLASLISHTTVPNSRKRPREFRDFPSLLWKTCQIPQARV